MKKFFVSILALATLGLVSASPALSVEIEDEQVPSALTSAPGFHGFELNEVSGLRNNVSVLMTGDATTQRLCTSTAAAPCNTPNGYSFKAVLGPCSSSVTVDCIESVNSISTAGAATAGVFKEYFPASAPNAFTGSPSEGVPDGKTPSMWTFANLPHAFGSDYQVTVEVTGMKQNGDALKPLRSLFVNITPVSVFQTTCNPQFNGTCIDDYYEDSSSGTTKVKFRGVAADQDGGYRCHNWGENAKCALKHAFPANARFGIKLRLSTTPSGWLHGRMKNPKADITRADNVTTVSLEADPVKVPAVSTGAQWASLPAAVQQWYTDNCPNTCGTRIPNSLSNTDLTQRNAIANPSAYSAAAFSQLKLWTEFIKDKATAVPSIWNVRTLDGSEMQRAPKCIKEGSGVTGIVATNSTLYAEGPPEFDTTTSSLNYKVASPHYEKNGTTEFKGTYDLVLRSDIAKCLYGFDDASSTAKVEVTEDGGTAKTATTSMSVADGWFKFGAAGFTFSAPTVKVTLIKPAAATPPVIATPIAAPAPTPAFVVPTLKKGKTRTVASVAKAYGLSVPAGAKVVVSVAAKSKKVCSVSGNKTIRAIAKGSCTMKISVTPKATAKVKKPKTTSKTATVKIS